MVQAETRTTGLDVTGLLGECGREAAREKFNGMHSECAPPRAWMPSWRDTSQSTGDGNRLPVSKFQVFTGNGLKLFSGKGKYSRLIDCVRLFR